MLIPITIRLRKRAHQLIAATQDIILIEVYSAFPKAVLHGGTAIWRCYGGNRFSEDLDFYLPSREPVQGLFQRLEQLGCRILKQRLKQHSLYSAIEFQRTKVRLEALFMQKRTAILKEYELADGNKTTVYTLSPEELLQEKISACQKRKKVRDLYDVFFLLRFIKGQRPPALDALKTVSIIDEAQLHGLILSGAAPSVEEMKRYIATWGK